MDQTAATFGEATPKQVTTSKRASIDLGVFILSKYAPLQLPIERIASERTDLPIMVRFSCPLPPVCLFTNICYRALVEDDKDPMALDCNMVHERGKCHPYNYVG